MPWPALIPLGHHQGKPAIPIMRPVLLVGSRHNAHLHLLSRQISKAHAFIISSDGRVYIRDLASRTHVYVNGQEVREADLVDGDMLKLGSFTFRFQAAAGMKQKPAPDTTPAGQLDVEGGQFPLQIDERVMLVGRRPACDVSLTEESCSTAHAVFFSMGGKRYVRDLGSRTGTFVNGTNVRQSEINFGDTVRIGDSDIRYEPSNMGAFGGEHADELEDLVGTAPLLADEFHRPEPVEAPSFDLGLDEPAKPAGADDVIPFDFETDPPAQTADHDLIPLDVDDAPAPVAEPQMLVGDNLMGEKLSASATGAGMQDAAREAMELAGETPPPVREPFDLAIPVEPAAVEEMEPLELDLAPEPTSTTSHAPSMEPIKVESDPFDLTPVESHVSDAPLDFDFADEAAAQAVSEDELLADLSAPAKPPVETPRDEALAVESGEPLPLEIHSEALEPIGPPAAAEPEAVAAEHLPASVVEDAEAFAPPVEIEPPTSPTDAFDALALDEDLEGETVAAEQVDFASVEAEPVAEDVVTDDSIELLTVEPEAVPSPTVEPESSEAVGSKTSAAVEVSETPLVVAEEPEMADEPMTPLEPEPIAAEALAAPELEPLHVEEGPVETLAVDPTPMESAVAFDAGSLAAEVEHAEATPLTATPDAEVPAVVETPVAEAPAVDEVPHAPVEAESAVTFDAGSLAAEATPTVAENSSDVSDTEIFFGDEPLDEITHEPHAVVQVDDELLVEDLPAVQPHVDDQVIEATAESALPFAELEALAEPSIEAAPLTTVEASLSDTTFGRQVAEFSADSLEPIVESDVSSVAPVVEEVATPEVAAELPVETEAEIVETPAAVTGSEPVAPVVEEVAVPEVLAETPVEADAEITEPLDETPEAITELEAVAPAEQAVEPLELSAESESAVDEAPVPVAELPVDVAEPLPESQPVAIEAPVAEVPAEIDLDAPAPGDLDFGFTAPDEAAVGADSELEMATVEVTMPAAFAETPDVVADVAHAFTEVPAEAVAESAPPVAVEPEPLTASPDLHVEPQVEEPAFEEALELEFPPEASVLDHPTAVEDLPLEEFPEALEDAPVEEFHQVEDAFEAEPADAFGEPAAPAPAYGAMPLIPGMPLNFADPSVMPDFVGGLPLVLDELAPPPPTFGRVQVSFNGSLGPQSFVDEPITSLNEPGPFDNLQIDIDNPLTGPAPVRSNLSTGVEDDAFADKLVFDESTTVEPEPVEPATPDTLEPSDELLELHDEPATDEALLEAPAPEITEDEVTHTPPAVDEAPAAGQDRRNLFANRMRVPPPPTRRPRDAAAETKDTPAAPAGFSAFAATPQGFEGLTSASSLGNVDVFSQGFSADLSNDPVFGGAVKPTPKEPESKGRRIGGAAPQPERAGTKKRRTLITPVQGDVEEMAGKLADDLGAPPLSDLPVREEKAEPAGTRSKRKAVTERPSATPRAYPEPAAPRRRNGGRVAVLLTVMVVMMAAAAWLIFTFLHKEVRFTGMLPYENFGKLTAAQQQKLKLEQQTMLIGERLRDVALAEFKHDHPNANPGFLGSLEEFGRNEFRTKWDKGTLIYTYDGSDAVLDGDRVRAVLEGLSALDEDVRHQAGVIQQQIKDARANLDQKERLRDDMAARRDAANRKMAAQPADDQVRALRAEADTAEKALGDATVLAQQAGDELKKLELASLGAASVTQPSDATGIAPPTDPQLAELEKSLDAMKSRMATARNTVSEQAELARKSLDAAIEELQHSTATAEGMLKDNPELSAFVAEAQKTQQTVQKLATDLLDRQQKQYEKLVENKTRLDEHLAQRRKELWDSDKQIKLLKDDLAMHERGYNAAREQGYETEAAQIHKELENGLAAVEKRKADLESDAMLAMLNDLMARCDQDIATATRQLDADRAQADGLAAEIQKGFAKLAPAVAKLPESQRTLAQQMSGKMEAVNNARKTVADAIEAKNPANGGLKMLDDQVKQLTAQVEERKKIVEALNNQQLPEDEMKKRQAAAEQKRAAYATAVKTKADLEAVWFDKLKQVQRAEAMLDAAGTSKAEYDTLTNEYFNLRDKELPQLQQSLKQQEQNALTLAYPSEPKLSEPVLLEDRRLPYSALAVAGIALLFSLTIFFSTHSHKPIRDPYAYQSAHAAPDEPVEAFGGLGLVDVDHDDEHEESNASAAA